MTTIYKTVGENIVRLRQSNGWSQEDLAYSSGVTVANISRIERGVANPTLRTLDKIADALGVDTDSLLRFWYVPGSRIAPGAFFIMYETVDSRQRLSYNDYKYIHV